SDSGSSVSPDVGPIRDGAGGDGAGGDGGLAADKGAPPVQEPVGDDKPLLWWRFEEIQTGAGAGVKNSGSASLSAAFKGVVSTVRGGLGGHAAWFNGHDGHLDLGYQLRQALKGASGVTYEGWFRGGYATSSQFLFAHRINDKQAGFEVELTAVGTIKFGVRGDFKRDAYRSFSVPRGASKGWMHFAAALDFAGKKVLVYLDGALVKQETINFASSTYQPGSVMTQRDQLACYPDRSKYFRGWMDSFAVFRKVLSASQIASHVGKKAGKMLVPDPPAALWESQIDVSPTPLKLFWGSPSIVRLKTGRLVASHDEFGDLSSSKTTVLVSDDNGGSWRKVAELPLQTSSTLFVLAGKFYLFGLYNGKIVIRRSDDQGASWTQPIDDTHGLLVSGWHHTGPVPVLIHKGRIYRAFERVMGTGTWPTRYAAMVVSAPVGSDLLKASSWTVSDALFFDPTWAPASWKCLRPGWLEGNAVALPSGGVGVLLRFHSDPVVGKAVLLPLSSDNKHLSFDPKTGFVDMPGGMHKFIVHRDGSGTSYALVNNNTDISVPAQRNTLSLIRSKDLRHWELARVLIQDDSPIPWPTSVAMTGFQYVDWHFDGPLDRDIIFISRTSYSGAHSYHDANRVTFHRLASFRKLLH
ncbi:MAG: hypothetical protein KAI47_25065, partial [Deltaproteobacteria bacterium]|nr:hypothetical protein [Deltaproteobacteria bacterium]